MHIEARHLQLLPEGYSNSLTLIEVGTTPALAQKFLHAGDPSLEVAWHRATALEPIESTGERAWRFLKLGLHHVLTGYDHLLFLAGIVIPCRRIRTLLLLISSFTLAHALTLGAALLGGVHVPGRVVEPLIAASIVFVGIENLLTLKPRGRYLVTFGFGLVHGLGFATALGELEEGRVTPVSLLSFNLGVELSQIAIAAAVLPAIWLARQRQLDRPLSAMLSALVASAGAYWLVQRVLFT